MLKIENLSVAVQGRQILHDINLHIKPGEVHVLFGPNGTGKSTLIGQAIGRMANLLNGDAFGTPTGSNFGLLYPEGTLAFKTYGAVPLWPAEVWEGQLDIVICGTASVCFSRQPK